MRTGFTAWTEMVLAQAVPYQGVVSFVIWSIEHEHRLNLDALTAYWLRASTNWLIPLAPHDSGPSNREGVAGAADELRRQGGMSVPALEAVRDQ